RLTLSAMLRTESLADSILDPWAKITMAVTGTAMIAVSQMFSLERPSEARIRAMLESQRDTEFSYSEVGATATSPPRGYNVDHARFLLGQGSVAFSRGKLAIE